MHQVLIHVIDGRERPNEPWRPSQPTQPDKLDEWTEFYLKQSASYVYAAQSTGAMGRGIPLFGYGLGLIFRPGAYNRNFCGFGSDSGGHGICHPVSAACKPGCSSKLSDEYCDPHEKRVEPANQAGTCGGLPWRTEDFGTFLQQAAPNGLYNEIVIDSRWWDDHLPHSIEFMYYGTKDASVAKMAREAHRAFVERYRLDEDAFPLVEMDKDDWRAPFKVVGCSEWQAPDFRYDYTVDGMHKAWHAAEQHGRAASAPCGRGSSVEAPPPPVEDWNVDRPAKIVGFG